MLNKRSRTYSVLTNYAVIGLVVMASCTHPVYNVNNTLIETRGVSLTMDQVSEAIKRAGATTRIPWQINEIQPGLSIGVLKWKQHQAVVNINYTTENFSITYKDSTLLRYEPPDQKGNPAVIGRHYNDWVEELEKAIKSQLLLVTQKTVT